MSNDLPRSVASGVYPSERAGDFTFAWSHSLATYNFRSLDRSTAWHCSVVARGARPAGVPQPEITVGVDGVNAATHAAGNEFQSIDVLVPARTARGLSLSISASPVYVPGPGDPRQLGVQIDRIACTPDASIVTPGTEALSAAAIAGAVFGLLFAVLCTSGRSFAAAIVLFSSACGMVLTTGPAVYVSPYLEWWLPVSAWIAFTACALLVARDWQTTSGQTAATRFVIGFSAAALFLKIIALLHPSKDVVDALFHARRLEWVLDGRYYFTQPMPGGVQFPYAIGLYVAAAPFAGIIRDHIALLRIVVAIAESLAAMCVYLAVSRLWGDRLTGAIAAVLYHLAPLPYVVIGNANLTFAFGQSIAGIATAAAMLVSQTPARAAGLAVLFCLTCLAFLSHVAVFPLLGLTLVTMGALYWWTGDEALKRNGVWIGSIAVVAAILSIGVYYAHFPEVYATLDRISTAQTDPGADVMPTPPALSVGERVGRGFYLGQRAFGVPLVTLALVGIVVMWRGPRDRLTLGLMACAIAMVFFVAFRIVAPVDARLQRYADEFIDRVYYLTLGAVAVAAARGFAWSWRAGLPARASGVLVLAAALWIGLGRWTGWIR
jgi:hypothetical protein